jgi:hypothetical protein
MLQKKKKKPGMLHIVTRGLKARIVEPEETVIARQRNSKPLSIATNAHGTIYELFGHCWAMQCSLCNPCQ